VKTVPVLSLIIATRNRRDSLRRLLPQLNFMAARGWELIIVDNGSTDGTTELLRQAEATGYVRAVIEPRRGKGLALNAGIAAARGELLVFSDDDIEPDAAWLDGLFAAAERHPDADVFGGRILVDPREVPHWIRESRNLQEILLTQHDFGDREISYPPNRFPQGPNMAVRRRTLNGLQSPWAPDVGPGCALPVGDETCFFYRLGQGGKKRIYVASAVVRHRIEGYKLRFPSALRRCYWGGYSGGLLRSRFPAQVEAAHTKTNFLRILGRTRSWKELACVAVRAAGYLAGRRHGKTRRA
jgi:glycosyltransferase involved in cell wall biosynthesis